MLDQFPESSWSILDDVDLRALFQERFMTLQSCPQSQFRGRFRQACRKALEARRDATNSGERVDVRTVVEVVLFASFLAAVSAGEQAQVTKEDLCRRFDLFDAGTWDTLLDEAVASIRQTSMPRARHVLNMENRGKAARKKAQLHSPLATTKRSSNCKLKRPQEVQWELPEQVRNFVPESPFEIDRDAFWKSLKTSPRGSSPGPGWVYLRTFEGTVG